MRWSSYSVALHACWPSIHTLHLLNACRLFTQLITDSSLRMLVRGTQLTGEVDLDSLCRACLGKVWGYGLVQVCC